MNDTPSDGQPYAPPPRLRLIVTFPDEELASWDRHVLRDGDDEYALASKPQTRTRLLTDLMWVERLIREHVVRSGRDEYDIVPVPTALMQYVATYADGELAGEQVDLDWPLERLVSLHLKLWRNVPNEQ